MITFKEYYMLQEAPVGAAAKAQAARTSKEMMAPAISQGRPAGGGLGQQGDYLAAPQDRSLQTLQNHFGMKAGAQDPATATVPAPAPAPAPAAEPHPGAFNTPFDREIAELDFSNPAAVQDLIGRMNDAIVANQDNLDKQDAAAAKGLPAPDQDKLGQAGANLGKQRNYVQSQQM